MNSGYLHIVLSIFIISLSITIVGVEISLFLLLTFVLVRLISIRDLSIDQPLIKENLLIPLYAIVSVFVSQNFITSFMNFSALWVYLSYPVLFYAIGLSDLRYIEKALKTSILISATISIYAIIQHYTGLNLFGNIVRQAPDGIRFLATAHFNKHSTFAFTTTFILIYTMVRLIICEVPIRERILLIIASVIMIYAILFSYVRAPIIMGIIASSIVLLFLRRKIILYISTILLGIFSTLYILSPSVIKKYIEVLSYQSESGWQRLFIYKRTLEMFAENTGSGIGFGNFNYYTYIYFDSFYRDFQVRCHAHNLFLQYLTEMGVIGFLLIFLLIFHFIQKSYMIKDLIPRSNRRELSFYIWSNITFITIVLSSLVQCTIYDGHIAFFFFFSMALAMNLYQRYKNTELQSV